MAAEVAQVNGTPGTLQLSDGLMHDLLKLRDEVLDGKHPQFVLSQAAIAQLKAKLASVGHSTAIAGATATSGARDEGSLTPRASTSVHAQPTTAGQVKRMTLAAADPRAEEKTKRARIEQELQVQLERRANTPREDAVIDVDAVLAQAQSMVRVVSGLRPASARPSSKSSFDENDYYSSQVQSPWSSDAADGKEQAEKRASGQVAGSSAGMVVPDQTRGVKRKADVMVDILAAAPAEITEEMDDEYEPQDPDNDVDEMELDYEPGEAFDGRETSDYEPQSAGGLSPEIQVVRNQLTHIDAPQPNRVSPLATQKQAQVTGYGGPPRAAQVSVVAIAPPRKGRASNAADKSKRVQQATLSSASPPAKRGKKKGSSKDWAKETSMYRKEAELKRRHRVATQQALERLRKGDDSVLAVPIFGQSPEGAKTSRPGHSRDLPTHHPQPTSPRYDRDRQRQSYSPDQYGPSNHVSRQASSHGVPPGPQVSVVVDQYGNEYVAAPPDEEPRDDAYRGAEYRQPPPVEQYPYREEPTHHEPVYTQPRPVSRAYEYHDTRILTPQPALRPAPVFEERIEHINGHRYRVKPVMDPPAYPPQYSNPSQVAYGHAQPSYVTMPPPPPRAYSTAPTNYVPHEPVQYSMPPPAFHGHQHVPQRAYSIHPEPAPAPPTYTPALRPGSIAPIQYISRSEVHQRAASAVPAPEYDPHMPASGYPVQHRESQPYVPFYPTQGQYH